MFHKPQCIMLVKFLSPLVLKLDPMYIFSYSGFSPGLPSARKVINTFIIYSELDALRSMKQGSCIMHHTEATLIEIGVNAFVAAIIIVPSYYRPTLLSMLSNTFGVESCNLLGPHQVNWSRNIAKPLALR